MYILDFIRYFRPHVWRIALSIVFMMGFAVTGPFNLVMCLPVVKIIVNEMTLEQYEKERAAKEAKQLKDEQARMEAPDKDQQRRSGAGQWWREKKAQFREKIKPYRDELDTLVDRFYLFAIEHKVRTLLYLSLVILMVTIIRALCEYFSKYLLAYVLNSCTLSLKEDLFAHIMGQDASFFHGETTGFLESRINNDVKALEKVFDSVTRDAVQQPLTIIAFLSYLFYLSWQLTLLAIVILPIAAIPIGFFSRQLRKNTRRSQRELDRLSSHAEEALRNFRIIKVYSSERYEIDRFKKRNARLLTYFIKRRVSSFAQSPIMEVLGTMSAVAVLTYGGYLVTAPHPILTGADFIIFIAAMTQFYTPIRRLTSVNVYWQAGRVSAERINEMFNIRSVVVEKPGARPLNRIEKGIVFDHVTFRYHETAVLDDVNLTIPLGKTVAIVGRSGAGKTSLANLLPRLYDPSEGAVLFDGVPATEYRLADLRRRFGVVTQETILFNDTVARNIAYAETGPVDMARVEQAARQAFAHDFIMALDGGLGYETVIGQSGARLSGGQRQRLAIARAIYRNPQILIFDEATSALDEESQRHVQAAIDNLLKGRTAIVIAHRLSTVRNADIILVMDSGKIVESGSHDELMGRRGLYWFLYDQGELFAARDAESGRQWKRGKQDAKRATKDAS